MKEGGYFTEGSERSERHQAILELDEDDLHREYPFTKDLEFCMTKTMDSKAQDKVRANERTPKTSVIHAHYFEDRGKHSKGDVHGYVIGDEKGVIMPKLLLKKLQTVESGLAFGHEVSISVSDEERDKLYAVVRAAQLADISLMQVSDPAKAKKKAAKKPVSKNTAKKRKAETDAPL